MASKTKTGGKDVGGTGSGGTVTLQVSRQQAQDLLLALTRALGDTYDDGGKSKPKPKKG